MAPQIGIDNNCNGEADEGCSNCPCFTAAEIDVAYAEHLSAQGAYQYSNAYCYDDDYTYGGHYNYSERYTYVLFEAYGDSYPAEYTYNFEYFYSYGHKYDGYYEGVLLHAL